MSDRTSELRETVRRRLERKNQESEQAYTDLLDEVTIHHRVNRVMFDSITKERLYQKCKGVCVWCDQPLTYQNSAIDHIFPLAKGGTNSEDNLQLLHPSCNKSKGATLSHLSSVEVLQFLSARFSD